MRKHPAKHRSVIRIRFGGDIAHHSSLDKAIAALGRRTAYYHGATSRDLRVFADCFKFTYEDGSPIERSELRRVLGPRREDEHSLCRGHGPVYGVHKISGRYTYYRHPKTMAAKRANGFVDVEAGEPAPRHKQSPANIPSSWDDFGRNDFRDRSWKRHRAHQWK